MTNEERVEALRASMAQKLEQGEGHPCFTAEEVQLLFTYIDLLSTSRSDCLITYMSTCCIENDKHAPDLWCLACVDNALLWHWERGEDDTVATLRLVREKKLKEVTF